MKTKTKALLVVLSLTLLLPGFIAPVFAAGTLIGSDCSQVGNIDERIIFTASNGNIFVFYWDGSNIVVKASTDGGATWGSKSNVLACSVPPYYSVWYDPDYSTTYCWIVASTNTVKNAMYMIRGSISGSSITWGTTYTVASSSSILHYDNPVIIPLSDGKLQVYAARGTTTMYWYMWYNANNDGSGTWTGYGNVSSSSYSGSWYGGAVSLTSTKAYTIYITSGGGTVYGKRWNGASFDSEATLTTASGSKNPSISNDGDVCEVVWRDGSSSPYKIIVREVNSDNTLDDPVTIDSAASYTGPPTISIDKTNDVWFVTWYKTGANGIIAYAVYRSGSWGATQTWDTGQTNVKSPVFTSWRLQTANTPYSVYCQGASSPLNLYFKSFDITPSGQKLTVTFNQYEVETQTLTSNKKTKPSFNQYEGEIQTLTATRKLNFGFQQLEAETEEFSYLARHRFFFAFNQLETQIQEFLAQRRIRPVFQQPEVTINRFISNIPTVAGFNILPYILFAFVLLAPIVAIFVVVMKK